MLILRSIASNVFTTFLLEQTDNNILVIFLVCQRHPYFGRNFARDIVSIFCALVQNKNILVSFFALPASC